MGFFSIDLFRPFDQLYMPCEFPSIEFRVQHKTPTSLARGTILHPLVPGSVFQGMHFGPPLGFHKGCGQGQRPFLVAKTSLQGLGQGAPLPAATRHTFIRDWLEDTRPLGEGHFSEQGCMLTPRELQAVSGAQGVGPGPAIGKLLRWDGAGRLGTAGTVRKGSRPVLCSTPAHIEPRKTSELASLCPLSPPGHPVRAGHPPALRRLARDMLRDRALLPVVTLAGEGKRVPSVLPAPEICAGFQQLLHACLSNTKENKIVFTSFLMCLHSSGTLAASKSERGSTAESPVTYFHSSWPRPRPQLPVTATPLLDISLKETQR